MTVCTLIEKDGKPNWCERHKMQHRGHYAGYAVDPGPKGQKFRKFWDEQQPKKKIPMPTCVHLGNRLTMEEGKQHEAELLRLQVKLNTCGGQRHEYHCARHKFTNLARCLRCPDKQLDVEGNWIKETNVWFKFKAMIQGELLRLKNSPLPVGNGDGIVIVGGGKYFASAYCNTRLIRHHGCKLPIELWYLGRNDEMPAKWRKIVEPMGVRCVNADEVRKTHPMRILNGWELKPYAAAYSSFRRVLFLDADCFPMRDPTFVFHDPRFLGAGAVFQRDCANFEFIKPAVLEMFGIKQQNVWDLESGAFIVDRQRWGLALGMTVFLNSYSDLVYKVVHGDKTTFALAALLADQPYAIPPHPPGGIGGTRLGLMQKWFDGSNMWQHRIHCKPRLDHQQYHSSQRKKMFQGITWDKEIRGYLDELRKVA